jgi:hypothetical protein
MLTLSFIVNLIVLVPLLAGFALAPARMDGVFGAQTDARLILVCLYATIALASLAGLGLLAAGQTAVAIQLGATLFALQVAYKLMTVPMVGLHSPVVITHLLVVAVHLATLWTLWRAT